jgi:TATA-binding protein-associated factor
MHDPRRTANDENGGGDEDVDAMAERRDSHSRAGPSTHGAPGTPQPPPKRGRPASKSPTPPQGARAEGAAVPRQQQQQSAAAQAAAAVARRGAEFALAAIGSRFGPHLFALLPALWESMAAPLGADPAPPAPEGASGMPPAAAAAHAAAAAAAAAAADPQAAIDALQIIKVVLPNAHPSLLPQSLDALLPAVSACCTHPHGAVREAAARCAAALAAAAPAAALPPLLRLLLPGLDGTRPAAARLGVVQTVGAVAARLQTALVPFVVLLVVPLLRRMSDPHPGVRRGAALCFGRLVALLPLAQVWGRGLWRGCG